MTNKFKTLCNIQYDLSIYRRLNNYVDIHVLPVLIILRKFQAFRVKKFGENSFVYYTEKVKNICKLLIYF